MSDRLISLDAATEVIRHAMCMDGFRGEEGCISKDHAIKLLTQLPAAEHAEPRWIPCKDHLPTASDHKNGVVLVCYGNGTVKFNTCVDGIWVEGNPIFWMPLPGTYKKGKNGTD